jgi:hypothetical protein
MAVKEVDKLIAGVIIPEPSTGSTVDIGISPYALCSTFLDDRVLALTFGKDHYFVSRQLLGAFSETVADISSNQTEVVLKSSGIDRVVRLFQGEIVVLGGSFDVSAAIAELKLRGFGAAGWQWEAGEFRLSLEPEFVRSCFGDATLLVNGKEVEVSGAGLLLLRQSELTLAETPALDELISLLRLERVVPRDVSELREVARRVGLEWAIDFGSAGEARASDEDLADLVDSAFVTSVGDSELAELFELEAAVSSRQPLEALSKTASFRAGDWQSVVDVLFRYTRAKPSRWRETSHALKEILQRFPESAKCLECQGQFAGENICFGSRSTDCAVVRWLVHLTPLDRTSSWLGVSFTVEGGFR